MRGALKSRDAMRIKARNEKMSVLTSKVRKDFVDGFVLDNGCCGRVGVVERRVTCEEGGNCSSHYWGW